MAQQTIVFSEDFDASVAAVFEQFADHARFGAALGGPVGRRLRFIRRVRLGDDLKSADGVGSVRRIGYGPTGFEETVTAFEPLRLIEYRITRGSPLKHHHGRIEFYALPGHGTHVEYTIVFEPRVPGTGAFLVRALNAVLTPGFERMRRSLKR